MFYLDSRKRGNDILLRYIDDNNQEQQKRIKGYKPSLFLQTSKESKYHDLVNNYPLARKQFNSIKEANNEIFESRETTTDFYGNRNFHLTFLHEQFKTTDYDPKLIRTFIIDIECPSEHGFPEPMKAEWCVDALTIYDNITDCYYLLSLYDFDLDDPLLKTHGLSNVKHVKFTSEVLLLKGLLGFWQSNYPVNVSGWHSKGFDIVYLVNRMNNLGIDYKKLSPWGVVDIREKELYGKPYQEVNILGVNDLDYLELYKKNRFKPRESYKLGFIANAELGTTKIDFTQEASDLRTLHKINPQKYQVYNIVDVQLVKKLDDKLGFFGVTFAVAYFAGINFGDVKSPVMTWNNIMYKYTINDNVILPSQRDSIPSDYDGGFVRAPIAGLHRWVCSFDLASLYPSIIRQFNISPETISNEHFDVNVQSFLDRKPLDCLGHSVCPSGVGFRNDKQGIAPKIMEVLYNERKSIKQEMLRHEDNIEGILDRIKSGEILDNELAKERQLHSLANSGQMVRKILLNSYYGATAHQAFCLYDIRLAESVTLSGQLIIQWIADIINNKLIELTGKTSLKSIVYGDTDSIYVSFEDLLRINNIDTNNKLEAVQYLDDFCNDIIQPIIKNGYDELKQYSNAFEQLMFMDREVISDVAIFIKKKKYAMSVWDNEGVRYSEPHYKFIGMELVKSDTPEICRNAMKDTVKLMLNGDQLAMQNYIKYFKEFHKTQPVEAIAAPKGVNKLEESYCRPDGSFRSDVTVPFNSRAAINYNNELNNLGLEDYERIRNADKMKYVYLEEPNRLQQNIIGFVDRFPKEFNLTHKVDYAIMYYKTFLKPIQGITQVIGWETEEQPSLDGLFIS